LQRTADRGTGLVYVGYNTALQHQLAFRRWFAVTRRCGGLDYRAFT
jgi:hypothetical protein